jgi:hypothetical protein
MLAHCFGKSRTGRQRFLNHHRFECLERRDMLSGTPPKVVDVEVGSTSWSPAFVQHLKDNSLGTVGYSIPTGSSAQSASLTWTNVDQIHILFSEDVDVDKADLSLSGINTVAYEFSDFHYEPLQHVATWTLVAPLGKDRLRLDLDTDGTDPVIDLDANILDGEWTNNVSTISGNGTVGGDFQFNFNVLPTDVNNSGSITAFDYFWILQLDGKSTSSSGYLANRDINGSGTINSVDWSEALARLSDSLPTGSPAGTNNDAPTSSGIARVEINNAAVDVAISLPVSFGDLESGGNGLTYSIRSNSNASLFDTATINPSTKQLVLNTVNGVSGRASIVVRATDPNGLFVETPVTVDVSRQNLGPAILNFKVTHLGDWSFAVSGDVVDPDDDVSDFIVRLWNVFDLRSAVNENGHFDFFVVIEDPNWNWEFACTSDPHGLQSQVVYSFVGLT